MGSDRNLQHLYPPFREKVEAIQKELDAYCKKNYKGHRFKLIEGFRTAEYQNSLYRQGRTKPGKKVTNCDGYLKKSPHQYGLAVDFWPFYGFIMSRSIPEKHWEYLGHLYRKYDLDWGGDWESFKDRPHGEWKRTDKVTYAKAFEWTRGNT